MRRPIELLVVLVACGTSAEDPPPNPDRRVEVAESSARNAARSVALVVKRSLLPAAKDGRVSLVPQPLGERLGLCPDERFAEQPSSTIGGATAFLVAPDKVATAAHVVDDVGGVDDFTVAFGFEGTDASVAEGDVYAAKAVAKGEGDFAIVTLARSVDARTPLSLRRDGEVAVGQAIVVVGHPLGLSMKAAPGTVRVKQDGQVFFDTDTNQGNSGSPVLVNDVVEGLFSAAERTSRPPRTGARRPSAGRPTI